MTQSFKAQGIASSRTAAQTCNENTASSSNSIGQQNRSQQNMNVGTGDDQEGDRPVGHDSSANVPQSHSPKDGGFFGAN